MSAASTTRIGGATAARLWHGLTASVCTASLLLQLALVLGKDNDTVAIRLGRLLSFFTIESNILVAVVCWTLVVDPWRDGRSWRVARLAAVACIAVTGLVYVSVLRGLFVLTPAERVADTGLHYLTPLLVVVGWLAFGPRPRVDRRSVAVTLAFPVLWLAFTLVRGAATGWYPYPFVDADAEGYAAVALNCGLVTALFLVLSGVLLWLDRRLPGGASARPSYGEGSTGQ